jgi:threonine dehydrogenase-like Zn-dependent dehydrogenase
MLFGFSGIQPRLDGGMAEFVLVPQADLVLEPLLPGTDPRAALLAADVLPTALSAVDKSGARAGQRMAIVGAGPVGLLSAFLARDAGADVTLFEINSHRIERVTAAGFHVVAVDADGGRPPEDLRHSFDAAIDAVGGQRGLKAALDLARPNGRVIGAGSQASEYAMNWGALFQHEMTIGFVIGNAIGMKSVVNEVLPRCGPILDAIFSDLLPLSSVPEYFHSLYRRERFKALVEVR